MPFSSICDVLCVSKGESKMSKFLKYIGKYKWATIFTPILVITEVIVEIIIPIVMGYLIDFGIEGNSGAGDMNSVIKYGVILIFLTILAMSLGVASGKTASVASTGFAKNLRNDMYKKIQKFSFANIDKFSTSSLVTRMTTDVLNVRQAFQMLTRVTFRAPLMFLFSIIAAWQISPELSKYFFYIIPILTFGLGFIIYKAFPWFEKLFSTFDKLNLTVQENIRGVRVVKSYNLQDDEIKKFNKVSNEINDYSMHAEKIVAFNRPLMQFSTYAVMIMISWIGAKLVVSNTISTGNLMTLMTYSSQILMSMMMVSMIFVMLTMAKASADRILEVVNEVPDLENNEDPIYEVKDGSIEFKNVNFSYVKDKNKLSLKNVDLKINAGETIGILGGTGSSKSTLVQLIPRLYDATEGEVLVGGENVKNYDIKTLRNEVAMVLQKNVLFSGTIKENLRWGNENATEEEMINACKLAQADEFIQGFEKGYDTYIEQGGTNVSGGQKQRLCIARALLKKPKILILDDSTSAVDTKTDALIRKAFKEEIPNITKIIIAQRVSSVEDADKIIILDEGNIVACGNHRELIETSEIYQDVYNSQMNGGKTDNE